MNWAGYEIAPSPRDGRELRSGKEKHEVETAGTAERQHPLPDILRRDNRSDTAIDKLQAVGRRNDGTCQIDRDCNERLVRDTERTLRSLKGQGQDEADGNPLHLLRHPHGKRGSAGGQDRTKGAFGGCLTLKLAVNAELLCGNCIHYEKRAKNPAETTGNRYKIEILMSRTQKFKGLSAASLRLKTLNDNP